MCDPISLSLAGTAIGAAGSIVSGVQGAQAAAFNARVAENRARAEQARANFEIERMRENARQVRGAQRARFASAGVQIAGSPLAVIEDTAEDEELEVQSILFGSRATQANLRAQAGLSRFEGQGQLFSGLTRAAGTVLSGAASAGRFRQLNRAIPDPTVNTGFSNAFITRRTPNPLGIGGT